MSVDLSPFVGQNRVLLVDGLVDLFGRVCDSGESLWVSLEAPSGWGKTRVGKQFYARLAAGQSLPPYWPATIADPNRKSVTPVGERQAGSLPDYLWWGVSCSDRNGVAAEALRSDLKHLEEHAPFVDVVCRHGRGFKETVIEGFLRERSALLEAGALDLAGAVVPGLGLVALFARMATGALKSRREDQSLVGEASQVGAGGRELPEEVIEQLCALGDAGFPVVLFIEDIHLADATLIDVLEGVLRRSSHLLLVTTTWPGKLDDVPKFADLARDLGDQVLWVGYLGAAGPPFPDGAGLTELDAGDCAQLVRAHYPLTDSATVELLVERYRNPWALELVCDMPRYRDEFGPRGDLRIPAEDVDSLPDATLEDLYREYWGQLPTKLRLRYAVAAVISPEAINADSGRGHRTWSDAVLDEVIEELGLPTSIDLAGHVGAARDAYGWVTHVDDYLRRWAEADQHDVATEDGRRDLNKRVSNARRRILAAVADAVLSQGEPDSHSARTIISLHAEGFITDAGPVAAAIAVALDDIGDDSARAVERWRLYDLYLELRERDPSSVDADTDLLVRFNGIDAIRSAGRHDLAAERYRDLVALTQDTLGSDDLMTLIARNNLAMMLKATGRSDEAVALLEQVLADGIRVLGFGHPETLIWRNNIATTLPAAGRVEEAIALLEQALDDSVRVLGTDHPETLRLRSNVAAVLHAANRTDEAVVAVEEVLADRIRVLGTDHPDTLRSRNDLAGSFQSANRVAEAIALFEQALADSVRVLGTDHPTTLRSRNGLAGALWAENRVAEAIALFEQALADGIRVLTPDHPEVLRSRNGLAVALHAVDRDEEAVAIVEQIVAERTGALGADHPETLQSRTDLAGALHAAGRTDEAITIVEQILADRVRVQGIDHPDTQTSLGNLGGLLRGVGRVEEAIARFEQALHDSIRSLGHDHPATGALRRRLAGALQELDRTDEAISVVEQILAQSIRVLGIDHPDTLKTRAGLAAMLHEAGRIDEANAIIEQTLDE